MIVAAKRLLVLALGNAWAHNPKPIFDGRLTLRPGKLSPAEQKAFANGAYRFRVYCGEKSGAGVVVQSATQGPYRLSRARSGRNSTASI